MPKEKKSTTTPSAVVAAAEPNTKVADQLDELKKAIEHSSEETKSGIETVEKRLSAVEATLGSQVSNTAGLQAVFSKLETLITDGNSERKVSITGLQTAVNKLEDLIKTINGERVKAAEKTHGWLQKLEGLIQDGGRNSPQVLNSLVDVKRMVSDLQSHMVYLLIVNG